jgi:hypothetical protein
MYYGWSKEFLEAGKRRLGGDTARAATPLRALADPEPAALEPIPPRSLPIRADLAAG